MIPDLTTSGPDNAQPASVQGFDPRRLLEQLTSTGAAATAAEFSDWKARVRKMTQEWRSVSPRDYGYLSWTAAQLEPRRAELEVYAREAALDWHHQIRHSRPRWAMLELAGNQEAVMVEQVNILNSVITHAYHLSALSHMTPAREAAGRCADWAERDQRLQRALLSQGQPWPNMTTHHQRRRAKLINAILQWSLGPQLRQICEQLQDPDVIIEVPDTASWLGILKQMDPCELAELVEELRQTAGDLAAAERRTQAKTRIWELLRPLREKAEWRLIQSEKSPITDWKALRSALSGTGSADLLGREICDLMLERPWATRQETEESGAQEPHSA